MHVLMVAPVLEAVGNQQPAEPHYPRVFYDAAHDCSATPGQLWRTVPLEGTILDLSGVKGQDPTPADIPEVDKIDGLVDIRDYVPSLGDPQQNPPKNLACLLTLPLGFVSTLKSPSWLLKGPPKQDKNLGSAAWKVVWTVKGIQQDALQWALQPLDQPKENPIEQPPALRPVKGIDPVNTSRTLVKLIITNSVRKESTHKDLPAPKPAPNTPMPHFQSFADLYAQRPALPQLIYTGVHENQGTPYSCLPSGGH